MIFNDELMYNFALFIFSVSCDCCVALLHNAKVFFLQFVIVVFPDHTHLLFWKHFVQIWFESLVRPLFYRVCNTSHSVNCLIFLNLTLYIK